MNADFDDKFQILFTKCVQASFELVNYDRDWIRGIYIYGSMERGMFFFNTFFDTEKGLCYIHELNEFSLHEFDLSDDRVFEFLNNGNELLSEIYDLFLNSGREIPTLIEMRFIPTNNSFDSKIIYELQYSNTLEKTAADCFDDWFEKIKQNRISL